MTVRLLKARVISNSEAAPGFFLLKVNSPELASSARPGQFCHIKCGDENGIILRRPLSFYDVRGGEVSFFYQVLGKGTQALKRRFSGEKLSILGPLGNGFSFEDNGRKKIIIAGGMGIAPFPFLIKEMISYAKIKPGDIVLVYGVRDKKFLINMNELRRSGISMYISTDNGSKGFKGRASQLLLKLIKKYKIKGDYFACGPQEMLEEITKVIGIDGQRVQVSLEEKMACGVGACLSCVRKVKGEYLRVCREGPVFWGDEVKWEART